MLGINMSYYMDPWKSINTDIKPYVIFIQSKESHNKHKKRKGNNCNNK